MKQISQEQIKQVMDTMMELNIPVKVYGGLQEMFAKLPTVELQAKRVQEESNGTTI
jgi:hypothetical protein